jgi:hypothetical protein
VASAPSSDLARNGEAEVSFWFDGDADAVLGELIHGRD